MRKIILKILKEGELDWIEDTTPKFTAELLEPGQKFYDKWGDTIRILEYLGRDDTAYSNILNFRKIKDPSNYSPYPGVPIDHPLNTDMILTPKDFDNYIDTGKLTPIFNGLNESQTLTEGCGDWDWIAETPAFLEIGDPVSNKNPKDVWKLMWTNGHGEESGTWADDWYRVANDSDGIEILVRLIKILIYTQKGHHETIPLRELSKLAANGETWVLGSLDSDYRTAVEGETIDDQINTAYDWLSDELYDYGILSNNSYYDDWSTLERWSVGYYDKYGVEHFVKVNEM